MKLLGRTTQPEDIDQCLDLLRDRFLYSAEQLTRLRSLWLTLLSRDIARSAVIFDARELQRILAFGIAAPLKQSRFDEIVRDRFPFIAKSLLEEWSSGRETFLDEREYAAANASAGLNVFTLHNGISETLDASALPNVIAKLSESFVTQYAGCRFKASVQEPFGVPPEIAIDLGLQIVSYAQESEHRLSECPADRKPFIAVVDREHAERHPGNLLLNTMFLRFTPPRFSFNAVERRLLRFAIEGENDLRIAELLEIAPRTLKKRWAEIYAATETVTSIPSGGSSGHRGAEVRRHVLRYIRQHPEELHPYASREVSQARSNGQGPKFSTSHKVSHESRLAVQNIDED